MENLDSVIGDLMRDKMITRQQENSVRVKKLNIRYTTNNKKNTLERLDEIVKSNERLMRDIVKDWMTTEKQSREKYNSPFSEKRGTEISKTLASEIGTVIERLTSSIKTEYDHLSRPGAFEEKIALCRSGALSFVDEQLTRLIRDLQSLSLRDGVMRPDELSKYYGLAEHELLEMKVVEHLQNIHLFLHETETRNGLNEISRGLVDSLKAAALFIRSMEKAGNLDTPDGRKNSKLQVAKAYLLFADLATAIGDLIGQWRETDAARNPEHIKNISDRILILYREFPDRNEAIVGGVRPLIDLLLVKEPRI